MTIFKTLFYFFALTVVAVDFAHSGQGQSNEWDKDDFEKYHPTNCFILGGKTCGCDLEKKLCWAYKFPDSHPGDPWCYTRTFESKRWATCWHDGFCDFAMSCADNKLYFGSSRTQWVTYEGEPNAASLRAKVNNCGTKPGNQCGCHKGYCWAYKFENSRGGDPWCYTQQKGVPGGHGAWAKCSTDYDCEWDRTCGDDKLYFGNNDVNALIYGGEADAASLRSKNSNCGTKPGNQCGCHKGYCWAYKFENSRGGDPWCYTQNRGVPGNQKAWAKCSTDYDCDWAMTCGDNKLYCGADECHPLFYEGEANAKSLKNKHQNAEARRNSLDPEVVAGQAALDAASAKKHYEEALQSFLKADEAWTKNPANKDLLNRRNVAQKNQADLNLAAQKAESFARATATLAKDKANQKLVNNIRAGHASEIEYYKKIIRDLCWELGIPVPQGF